MAYFYKNEAPKNHAGTCCIGAMFADERTHNYIMNSRDAILDIINSCTYDCVASRNAGVAVYAPMMDDVLIACGLRHRGVNLSLQQLEESRWVAYRAEVFSSKQVMSMPERQDAEKKLSEWFNDLLKEQPNSQENE